MLFSEIWAIISNMKDKEPIIKKYAFRFSAVMLAVLIAGLVLCVACFALTTWQFTGFLTGDVSSFYEWVKYALLYFVSVFLAVLITAMLVRSQYVLTEKELILQFGFLKTRYDVKKIFSVCLLNGSKKLCLYFDDFKTKYATVVVKEEWYDDFIKTLTSLNERIEFDFSTYEDEQQGKKNKKK